MICDIVDNASALVLHSRSVLPPVSSRNSGIQVPPACAVDQ
jgi:hypothetical protein